MPKLPIIDAQQHQHGTHNRFMIDGTWNPNFQIPFLIKERIHHISDITDVCETLRLLTFLHPFPSKKPRFSLGLHFINMIFHFNDIKSIPSHPSLFAIPHSTAGCIPSFRRSSSIVFPHPILSTQSVSQPVVAIALKGAGSEGKCEFSSNRGKNIG